MIDKDKIYSQVDEMSAAVFGAGFSYRKMQKETVVDILYNWLNGTENVILSAPTGSGKSIVAMSVAAVLNMFYGKRGYILISDLSLIEQYNSDVEKYFPKWSILKGQQTYECMMNGLPFNIGACKISGCTTYSSIKLKFPGCYDSCEYIRDRMKAISSPVTICTYAFWMIQQNKVKEKMIKNGGDVPFDGRDFVICDEAHKLLDIAQQFVAPRVSYECVETVSAILDGYVQENSSELIYELSESYHKIENADDNEHVFIALREYRNALKECVPISESVKEIISKKSDSGKKPLSKQDKSMLRCCSFLDEHFDAIDSYVSMIDDIGSEYIVKNDSDASVIVLNCLNESYIMKSSFHRHCNMKMYMSATIGNPDTYANDISGGDSYVSIKMPSVFDYTNSPIFYVSDYKMSYKEREISFPKVAMMIEQILRMYPDNRGIIQTGSYYFAKKLKESVSTEIGRRMIIYGDSSEKNDALELYKISDSKVLVGPSLIEGLSLDDDLCRFQIMMKVPYPSITDKFVSAKMNFYPQWYQNFTAISILQGIGRGVRNEKDWCVTFILDGCFSNLFYNTYSVLGDDFANRMQHISPECICPEINKN